MWVCTASASPAAVDAGGTVRYTVAIANNGPSPASDVSIGISGPASLIFGSIDSPGGPCLKSIVGNTVDCVVLAPLAAGGNYLLTIDARPTTAGTVSANFAVTASSVDPAPANNQVSVGITVNPATDLALTAGSHEFRLQWTRTYRADTQTPYQYMDNVVLVSDRPPVDGDQGLVGGGFGQDTVANPVPPGAVLFGTGLAMLAAGWLARRKHAF